MEAADYPANAEAREMAHRTRLLDKVVWPDEKRPNGDLYLNDFHNLANEMADAAIWEHLQGDDAHAIETVRDLLHLSLLVRQSRHQPVISQLLSIAFDAIAMDRLNVIVATVHLTNNPEETKNLSVLTARALIDELATYQLDSAQLDREVNSETGPDKLSPGSVERLKMQATRSAVEIDMTRLNLACHLYRHDHATWPASLDDLHAYMPQVPIDRLGDGKQKIGYVVIRRGLPDGADRPLIYSRYGSAGPLYYQSAQPEYSSYTNDDPVTGKPDFKAGGQFRDVAGWSPADPDHAPPTTRPVP